MNIRSDCARRLALTSRPPESLVCPMRDRQPVPSATAKTYSEILRISRKFLEEASGDFRDGHAALAQTQVEIAQRLLDLTAMLSRLLNSAAPSPEDWSAWKSALAEAADAASWPSSASVVEIHARKFLERVLMVRWGDLDSMRAPLPELRTS